MSKKYLVKLIAMWLLILLVFASCRKDEEPTMTPEDIVAEAEPTQEAAEPTTTAAEPTVTTAEPAEPTQEPTAVAEADWPPQVIYSSPAGNEEALVDGPITIRFDQPMDQQTVEASFDLTISDQDEAVEGEFDWPRPDMLIFTPRSSLEREQLYDIHIAESAHGRNGQPVHDAIDLQIQTVGFLEVSQVIPDQGTQEVQTDAAVTVMFNRPVVPLVSTGQQADLPQPLNFDPTVSGVGEWVSTSIYRFTPDEPLAGDTRYNVTVAAGLEDLTGGVIDQDFSWSFDTLSPSVVSITPADDSENVDPTRPMTITFNMPMDKASTEGSINLQPGAATSFAWSEDSRSVALEPRDRLDLATNYRLSVGSGARSATGGATLDRETSSNFSTVPFPAVLETFPAEGEMADTYIRGVRILFASPMNLDTLEDKVIIEPAPDRTVYFFNDFDFSLSITFDMENNTDYQISVPASAADPYGNTLGEDYVWNFRTPGFEPLVSLNLPDNVSQLSTSHASDIDVIHRNVSRIDAELHDLGLSTTLLASMRFYDYQPPAEPIRTWSIPVENIQDEAGIYNLSLADGDVLPTGIYYLSISAPEIDESAPFWQNQNNLLVIADTNLVVKEMFDSVYVWATELASGQPAAGRNLTLYDNEGQMLGTATTDQNGFANFAYEPLEDFLRGVLVVSNQPGENGFGVGNSNWTQGISPWEFGVNATSVDEAPRFAYLYTDRPIYRPGDTVFYRGVVRDTDYGRYPLPTDDTVTVSLDFITNYESAGYQETFTVDENGEFNGQYLIPEDAALGNYRLYFEGRDIQGDREFTIAQYRKPEFQVTATPSKDEILRGEAVDVLIEASFFFGGPAAELPVRWSVYDKAYQIPWKGPYYCFSDCGQFFYEPLDRFSFGGGGPFGEFLMSGEGQTDSEGRLLVRLPADLLEDSDSGSRTVTLEASVVDISNFPITARAEVVNHAGEIYVGVVMGDQVSTAGTTTDIDLITVDWDGQSVSDTPVDVVFFRRDWKPVRDETFGVYYTRWEATDTEIGRSQVTTDGQGKATTDFVPPDGGTYLAVATVKDAGGRSQTSSAILWAVDSNFTGWRSDPREKRMDLVADSQDYRPGETAQILVQSPFTGPVNAWLTIERGSLIEQRLITLESNSDILEIPITDDFAPNAFVSVAAVKGIDETNPYADMRLGVTELVVSPEHLGLNVTLTPQSELLQPGDTVAYDILVTDDRGNPVQANFSLALVDLAVLTLKPDNAPDILEAFYARQPMRSQTGTGLVVSGEGLEVEIPVAQPGMGGGGGGDAEAARTFSLEEEDDVRTDFPDTAFWEAKISTDANGRATVEIPLPDSVTTWRMSSKAVSEFAATNDTLVGQSDVDVIATLPLLIRPVTPRFFVVGDKLEVGAIIHNNTSEVLDVTASLEAGGLTHEGPAEQSVTIPAGGREIVQWPVLVDDAQVADLTFRAEGGDFRDATKPTFGIPPEQLLSVVRYAGEDVVGTSGVLDDAGRRVEAILLPPGVDDRQGQVRTQLSPSLAASLTEALDYVNRLEDRPACAHSVTDQLLPNVATFTALEELNLDEPDLTDELESLIKQDIKRLADLQKSDGGWGWCYSADSDPFLSAYSLLALAKAEEAGFSVGQKVMDSAARYLGNQIEDAERLSDPADINRQAFFLYVLAELGEANNEDLDDLFTEHRALMDPYAKALLALAYELSGGSSANQQLLTDLNDSVILSATGAHWEDMVPDWFNLSSDIRGTAMIIDALARLESDSLLAPGAVRWLMVARQAGHWPTGQENAWSILALTDWMVATGELDANYLYQVLVNGEQLADGQFGRDNITENVDFSVAVGDLVQNEPNFLDFQRGEGDGRLYYTTHLDSFIRVEDLDPLNRGVIVQRNYFDASCDPEETECLPIDRIEAGQQVRVELTVIAPNDLIFAVVKDPIPSGAEAIDPDLETTVTDTGAGISRTDQDYHYGYWGWWYFNRIEFRDDSVVFYSEFLPAGTYQYTYLLQATIPGEYQVIPATARQEFFPEVFGRSDGSLFSVVE